MRKVFFWFLVFFPIRFFLFALFLPSDKRTVGKKAARTEFFYLILFIYFLNSGWLGLAWLGFFGHFVAYEEGERERGKKCAMPLFVLMCSTSTTEITERRKKKKIGKLSKAHIFEKFVSIFFFFSLAALWLHLSGKTEGLDSQEKGKIMRKWDYGEEIDHKKLFLLNFGYFPLFKLD